MLSTELLSTSIYKSKRGTVSHTLLFLFVKLIELCSGEREEMESEAKFSGKFSIGQFSYLSNN